MNKRDSKRIQELRDKIKPLVAELNEIERACKLTDALLMVGKCFKFRNSYSCLEDEHERWWLYRSCVHVDADGDPVFFGFQTDMNGKIEIEVPGSCFGSVSGAEEISEDEFLKAWDDLVKRVVGLEPFAISNKA